jgi:hypothetical protein
MAFNAPGGFFCKSAAVLSCTAEFHKALSYLNDNALPIDNISYRAEFVDGYQGQRTGTKTATSRPASAWQHWFEVRPEVLQGDGRVCIQGQCELGHSEYPEVHCHRASDIIISF